MKIIIVEDDAYIREEIKILLEGAGYEVECVEDFTQTKKQILDANADLLLLDIQIPYMNGETLLRELRKESDMPVIMVTSKSNEIDEVLSMSYGADDYITKPYNPTLLLLRIQAVLKRLSPSNSQLSHYRDLEVDFAKGTLKNSEQEVVLTKNEMIIFHFLLTHIDEIVTRDDLMTELWDNKEYISDNALTVNISRLRGKLSDFGYDDVIMTRKGQGYILS